LSADLPAFVVDLDCTLVATDSLAESIFRGLRRQPYRTGKALLGFVGHRDRARLKRTLLACAGVPDVRFLPYRESVLAMARAARADGRLVVLATGAHQAIADAVADHLGVFDVACGTDHQNLTREQKRDCIERLLNGRRFTYVGDSADDLAVWQRAHEAIAVTPSPRVAARLRVIAPAARVLDERRGTPWRSLARVLRVHQWSKNALVFIPVIAGHELFNPRAVGMASLAAFAFSLMASAIYVLNDLFDLESDRQHPSKRRRPLAAGTVTVAQALGASVGTFGASLAVASVVGANVVVALLGYGALSLVYTLRLKRVLLLDAVVLASLYCLRVVVGGMSADVVLSPWLLAFMIFEFFGLALVKRSIELARISGEVSGRGYKPSDRPTVRMLGVASSMLGILVVALCLRRSRQEVCKCASGGGLLG
jgi:4-hydroxybenzoate polyprenyltransferase/phosphoserine phosphatase